MFPLVMSAFLLCALLVDVRDVDDVADNDDVLMMFECIDASLMMSFSFCC